MSADIICLFVAFVCGWCKFTIQRLYKTHFQRWRPISRVYVIFLVFGGGL